MLVASNRIVELNDVCAVRDRVPFDGAQHVVLFASFVSLCLGFPRLLCSALGPICSGLAPPLSGALVGAVC